MQRFTALFFATLMMLSPLARETGLADSGAIPPAKPDPLVKRELPSLRTQNSRTFEQNGHFIAELYGGSINYRDAQGQWQPIDNTLVPSSAPGYAEQNAANRYTVRFPQQLGTAPIRIDTPSGWVDFDLQGVHAAGSFAGNAATYSLPGGTIEFQAGNDGLKESIVLDGPSSPSTYVYDLKTGPGLSARQNSQGGIDFVDRSGAVSFAFASPFMKGQADVANLHVSHDVTLHLTDSPSGQTLTLAADHVWLADPARRYPVVIDPTATFTGANVDTYFSGGAPTTNNGAATNLDIGFDNVNPYRALLNFSVASTLPQHVQVLNAQLDLNAYYTSNTTAFPIGVYPVTTYWNGGATWNAATSTTSWTSPGGDYTTAQSATTNNLGTATGDYTWYPTQVVNDWMNGVRPDYGFLLKEPTENIGNIAAFYSSDYTGGTSVLPKLTVTYEPWVGEQSFFPLSGESLNDRMNYTVNAANGNLIVDENDLSMRGVGLPVSFGRVYNSLNNYSTNANWFGYGWSMDTGADIKLQTFNDGSVAYYGPSGYQVPFVRNADGTFTPPPGMDSDLTKNGDGTYTLADQATGQTQNFDATGKLVSEKDRAGNTISYAYDANNQNRLSSITDTQGRIFSFSYDTVNDVTQMTDTSAGGRTWGYAYNNNGDLATYTDPGQKTTQFTYDGSHRLTQITDPNGHATTFAYDTSGRISMVTRVVPTGTSPQTTFTYYSGTGSCTVDADHAPADYTVITDPNGHNTTVCYDAYGRTTQAIDPLGHATKLVWNSDHEVTKSTVNSGATTQTQYTHNDPQSVTVPTGASTSASYADTTYPHQPTSATDDLGNATSSAYYHPGDTGSASPGLVKTLTDASGHQAQFGYDAHGNLTSATDENAHQTTYSYWQPGDTTAGASANLLRQVTPPSPLGATTYTYDSMNHTASVADGKGQVTTSSTGAMDRLRSVTYADGSQTGYAYDANGNMTSETDNLQLISDGGVESGQGPWSESTANSGQLVDPSKPYTGKDSAWFCGYTNCNDQLWQTVTLPSSFTKVALSFWVYVDTQEPAGTGATDTFTAQIRTSTGATITTPVSLSNTNATNSWVQKTVDVTSALSGYAGQQVQVYFQGKTGASYTSDFYLDDATLNVASSTNQTTYTYDALGRLTQESQPNGSISYGYDLAGNLSSKSDAGGAVTYAYDAADRLTSVTDPSTAKTTYGYDGDDNPTSIAYPNGISETMSYDTAGQLTRIAATGCTSGTCPSFSYSYVNPATNAQTMTRFSMTDATGNVTSYAYDTLDRLTQAIVKSNVGTQTASDAYAYDPVGNITSKTVNGTATSYGYNAADEVTGATFDANGNETATAGGMTFVPNAADQIVTITPAGGSAIGAAYTGRGQSKRTAFGSNTYKYDQLGMSTVTTSAGTAYLTKSPSGSLISERLSAGTYYYLYDGLGSVVGLTNSAGGMVNSYAYDPYGNATSISETVSNPFRYIGGEWDSATGLYKFGERYYDPSIGRFTQLDPLGGGYLYADDNPVNETDPSGLCGGCALALELSPGLAIPGLDAADAVAIGAIVVVGTGYEIYTNMHSRQVGGSGRARTHSPRYNTRKGAREAAKRAQPRIDGKGKGARNGRKVINHPDDPYGPHYHANDGTGRTQKNPNIHYKYPG